MMKRNLFIGFGLGLVFSAGFLSVFSTATPSMELSKEQLEAYATAQNYVLVPKEQFEELKKGKEKGEQAPTKPTSPTKPSEPAAPSRMAPPATGSQPGQAVPPTGTQGPSAIVPPSGAQFPSTTVPLPSTTVPPKNVAVPNTNTPSTPAVPNTPVEVVTIKIPYKATAKTTAWLLVEAGLLPKNNNFIATLDKQNKLNRIRVGTYKIPKGTSIEKIIQILTTPPAQ